jgi:hypothetical protein
MSHVTKVIELVFPEFLFLSEFSSKTLSGVVVREGVRNVPAGTTARMASLPTNRISKDYLRNSPQSNARQRVWFAIQLCAANVQL